jgi:transcriptional regulator with XRE-family HTH domain
MGQTIGERLRQARRELAAHERRDVTQAQIAEASGVSAVQVSRYESDLQEPSVGVLARLAAALRVDPGWLAFGDAPATAERAAPEGSSPPERPAAPVAPLEMFRPMPDPRPAQPARTRRKANGDR